MPGMKTLANALVLDPLLMVAGLWKRRELIGQFTKRNIELKHRGSRLGAFWALINPLSMLVLYYITFGVLFGTKFKVLPGETGFDVLLAMFLGLSLFHAFSETLSWAPTLITTNPNFVKKVVFPLEVLPVAQIGAAAFHLAVDRHGWPAWGRAFGVNAIAAYAGSAFLLYALVATGALDPLYRHGFADWMTPRLGPYVPSLAYALAFVALWWAVVRVLDARRIHFKI